MKTKLLIFGILALAGVASAASDTCITSSGTVTGTDYPGGLNSCAAFDTFNSTVSATISNPQPSATNVDMETLASSNPIDPKSVTAVSVWSYTTVDREVYTVNATVFGGGAGVPGYSTVSITIGSADPVVLYASGSEEGMINDKILNLPGGTKVVITLLTSINGYGNVTFQLGRLQSNGPMVVGGSNTGPVCAQGEKGCNP